jgi:hypothetical protein
MAVPKAPLWVTKATGPGGVSPSPAWLKVASTLSKVFMKPRVLGPQSRSPPRRAASATSVSSRRPSSPISPKPELKTTALGTPLATHSWTAWGTALAGTATMARSTGPGMAVTLG